MPLRQIKYSFCCISVINNCGILGQPPDTNQGGAREDIEKLDDATKDKLYFVIDNIVQNSKAKKAYTYAS